MDNIHTVYVVHSAKGDKYYGTGSPFTLVPLKDAKIFSKRNTAVACSRRWRGTKVVPCTLTIHHDQALES